MNTDPTEYTGILVPAPGNRPVMSMPRPYQASKKFIREVQDNLNIPESELVAAADWIINKMEGFGAYSAQPVFDMNGTGPQCSWCGMIWPLCGHQHMSGNLDSDDDIQTLPVGATTTGLDHTPCTTTEGVA